MGGYNFGEDEARRIRRRRVYFRRFGCSVPSGSWRFGASASRFRDVLQYTHYIDELYAGRDNAAPSALAQAGTPSGPEEDAAMAREEAADPSATVRGELLGAANADMQARRRRPLDLTNRHTALKTPIAQR